MTIFSGGFCSVPQEVPIELALNHVSISFGGDPVLNSVDLRVAEGETVVLIGPSGEGKTVVLKLLAGLLQPDSGTVHVQGRDLRQVTVQERERLLMGMGMLFQRNALFDSLTVGENIAFPLREKSALAENEIQDRVGYYLEEVGIAHARGLYPDEISGGMQKRLGIARALALEPRIVLCDDPTAGLDPITSRRIADLILRLKQEHKSTLVAVTNDMARAYQLADRIAMVVDGEIIVTGDKSRTLSHADPRVTQFVRGRLEGPLTEAP
jgi:phospholipid/cholesterol/gamma-HCH transport system ATP-binding protein